MDDVEVVLDAIDGRFLKLMERLKVWASTLEENVKEDGGRSEFQEGCREVRASFAMAIRQTIKEFSSD